MWATIGRGASWLAGGVALFALASPALAVPQFVPTPGARLHTVTSGQPGTTYNTAGASDMVAYNQGTGLLTITGLVDEMNWYDPANGSCSTDIGSNCVLNYSTDLILNVQAQFQSLTVTPIVGTFLDVKVEFGPTGGVDVSWTDPLDGGSTQLGAVWQPGVFQGSPTTGLVASLFFDTATNQVVGPINVVGFASLDLGTPYASLFGSPGDERIELDIADLQMVTPDIGTLISQAIGLGTLPSFTAEADGQVFRVAAGQFVVPEPTTGLLVGLGLLGIAALRRSSRRV